MLMRLGSKPREHDFTKPMWGHKLHSPELVVVYDQPASFWKRLFGKSIPRQELRCQGHGSVRQDDTILVAMASGRTARFLVREIEYYRDPDDMFNIKRADFIDYTDEEL